MPAVACERCGKKDFSVDPTATGLCQQCRWEDEAKKDAKK